MAKRIADLANLLETLSSLKKEGCSQVEILDFLQGLCDAEGWNMHFDEHEVPKEEESVSPPPEPAPVEKKKMRQGKKKYRPLEVSINRGVLQVGPVSEGDKFSRLRESASVAGRVLITSPRKFTKKDPLPFDIKYNGVIIDAATWELLAVTPRLINRRPQHERVNEHLRNDEYHIVEVWDSTMVTLYQWDHPAKGRVWCIASNNGYDVSHFYWAGPKTYAEMLQHFLGGEVQRERLFAGDVRLDIDLPPGKCYTVGFHHRDFHPLADEDRIWNVQSFDLGSLTLSYAPEDGIPGIPGQKIHSLEEIATRFATTPENLKTKQLLLKHETIDNAALAVLSQRERGEFCYGFVLRSKDPGVTGVNSDILYESSLLQFLRRNVYSRPFKDDAKSVNNTNRMDYQAVRSMLSAKDTRKTFLKLFPQYNDMSARLNQLIDGIRGSILSSRVCEGKVEHVAKFIRKAITKDHPGFNPRLQKEAASIVDAYLYDRQMALPYLRCIC